VARQLRHFIAEPSTCAYLPDRHASLEYRLLVDVSPAELDHLLARGWRRFGPAYFKPRCAPCFECVPLRIPIGKFQRSRQQRRAWNRCRRFRVEVGVPKVDDARLDLYRAWHAMQGGARGWSPESINEDDYESQFAFPHPAARELAFFDDQAGGGGRPKLICVSIVDETPTALSAVYTYHHPAYRKLSLGTASILFQVEQAKAMGKLFVYLGYRVLGCKSSEYKARFRPHELLVGWPELDHEPVWREVAFDKASAAIENDSGE
jgi:arginine-tRNA-protein transferase